MCPDPALLVAYLDGTLFPRDKSAVDHHVQTCESCTGLLAAMRRQRAAEDRSRRSRAWVAWGTVGAVVVAAFLFWFLTSTPEPSSLVTSDDSTPPVATSSVPAPPPAPVNVHAANERPTVPIHTGPAAGRASAERAPSPSVPERAASHTVTSPRQPAVAPPPIAPVVAASADEGLTLRGKGADRRFVWRVRDRGIERSTDGGTTWIVEYRSDRTVRAGAFVGAEVAWLVGDEGLILRRTKNGWFGATPPAEGAIAAVTASSPSVATVTLADGRVFRTENGGVTWTSSGTQP